MPRRHPRELTTALSERLVEQIATFPAKPILVLTGGDPLKRDDIDLIVHCATDVGLKCALTPSATPLLTRATLKRLAGAGLHAVALSLDGVDALTHDTFRGVDGSFDHTLDMIKVVTDMGLPLQINTTVGAHNLSQLPDMADLISRWPVTTWSVFFIVPVGRAHHVNRLRPDEVEGAFAALYDLQPRHAFRIKTTEAPHYRRYATLRARATPGTPTPPVVPTNDGRGVMFVSHTGDVYPSGFMPVKCGRFPDDNVVDVYQNSPVFQALRDPTRLSGKCGQCEFKAVCGGSRARAFAVSHDYLAEEPDCLYIPVSMREYAPFV